MASRSSSTSFRTRSTPSTGEIRNSPGCCPGEARVSGEWPGVVGSPGLFPLPPVSLTVEARGLQHPQLQDLPKAGTRKRINAEIGGRIWFGGCYRKDTKPEHADGFFEALGPDGINTLEACFCGHDHVNSAVVRYKGVILGYGLSLDNIAYGDICYYGRHRGCTVFTLKDGGDWSYMQKNAYLDYKIPADAFYPVKLDTQLFPDEVPSGK